MCIYVSMHGIVIIKIYSYNKKVNNLFTVVASPSHILPKCAKTREPEDKCCVSQCTHISYNISDPIPLDNLKNHTALPYITIFIPCYRYIWMYNMSLVLLLFGDFFSPFHCHKGFVIVQIWNPYLFALVLFFLVFFTGIHSHLWLD